MGQDGKRLQGEQTDGLCMLKARVLKGTSIPAPAVSSMLVAQDHPFERLPHEVPPAVAVFQASHTQFT